MCIYLSLSPDKSSRMIWNFGLNLCPVNKSFIETFWYTQVQTQRYLWLDIIKCRSGALWWPMSAKTFKVFLIFCFYLFILVNFLFRSTINNYLSFIFGISLTQFWFAKKIWLKQNTFCGKKCHGSWVSGAIWYSWATIQDHSEIEISPNRYFWF